MAEINTIYTKEGDTVAAIAAAYYGTSAGKVEAVLAANPELCRQPLLLPAGLKINLPAIKEPGVPTIKTVNLWD